jgi:hypothetical protein
LLQLCQGCLAQASLAEGEVRLALPVSIERVGWCSTQGDEKRILFEFVVLQIVFASVDMFLLVEGQVDVEHLCIDCFTAK